MSQEIANTLTTAVYVESSTNTNSSNVGDNVNSPTNTSDCSSTFVGKGGNIPDGIGSFHDEIVIKDDFRITEVSVTLKDIVHTWVGDLSVRLCHLETNTVVDLFQRPGQPKFSSSGYCNDLKGDYSFSDHSNCNFEQTAATHAVIPSGKYASLQSLSVFSGMSGSGTWQLIIKDSSAGDSGSLSGWSLDFERE
jgi:subtilisin-like proprotein convertase family protein